MGCCLVAWHNILRLVSFHKGQVVAQMIRGCWMLVAVTMGFLHYGLFFDVSKK